MLIDSIESIELADITSFWTDKVELLPLDHNQEKWFEIWLKGDDDSAKISPILYVKELMEG